MRSAEQQQADHQVRKKVRSQQGLAPRTLLANPRRQKNTDMKATYTTWG
jgi:hypothetical protein